MSGKASLILGATVALAWGQMAAAADAAAPWQGAATEQVEPPKPRNGLPGSAGIDHISLLRVEEWRPVGREAIILWATPLQPYLLTLDRPADELPFVESVGVTSTGGELYAHFDSVIVHGHLYRIASIRPLSSDAAATLRSVADLG